MTTHYGTDEAPPDDLLAGLPADEIPGGTDSPDWMAIYEKLLMAAIAVDLGAVPAGELTPWHVAAAQLGWCWRPRG